MWAIARTPWVSLPLAEAEEGAVQQRMGARCLAASPTESAGWDACSRVCGWLVHEAAFVTAINEPVEQPALEEAIRQV
ncbi:hypothetical protein T484DRAFT_1773072 [Baffinella frigidus]|nr:hypothetical protein T484DRAFT_1773072 [Cryptophyta sp. CCMP2293]